jgi:hypothetical protein
MEYTTSDPTNSVLEACDLVHDMALGMAGIFSAGVIHHIKKNFRGPDI